MLEEVYKEIVENNLIEKGDRVVVGVSGGPDSICLLHVLNCIRKTKLSFDIFVCHINHMIRENAKVDEEYVEGYCKSNDIPFYLKKADVERIAKEEKRGTEETGRMVRYNFFDEVLKKTGSNKIATAHNKNDNTETVLMNIMRGTGVSGLKGIEIKRDEFIRPLINIKREDIEEYCTSESLNPREDESNKENIYTRNKIRNELIPYIKREFNPNIIEAIEKLSNIAKDETEFIDNIVKCEYTNILKQEVQNQIVLDLAKFNNLALVIKRRMILYTIMRLAKTSLGIEKVHIDDIIKLCKNNIGNKFLTPNKNIKILVKKGNIFFETQG